MLTTEERQLELIVLVDSMRTAQKEFVKSRSGCALEDARYFERQVDRALRRFRRAKRVTSDA